MGKQWKLEKDVEELLKEKGFLVKKFSAGNSPYSTFDIVACPSENFTIGKTPGKYAVSPIEIKSADPQIAYKGRHGIGRLIMASFDDDNGIVEVSSNGDDTVVLELVDGTSLGHKKEISLGELFPQLHDLNAID